MLPDDGTVVVEEQPRCGKRPMSGGFLVNRHAPEKLFALLHD